MLRRFAALISIAFLLALFLPLAMSGPPVAPDRATSSILRLAPVVVRNILPATLNAQAVADTSVRADSGRAVPGESGGHSARFWALIVAIVVVAAWGCWRFSKRGEPSTSGS